MSREEMPTYTFHHCKKIFSIFKKILGLIKKLVSYQKLGYPLPRPPPPQKSHKDLTVGSVTVAQLEFYESR